MVQKKTKGIVVGYGRKSKEDKNAKGVSLSNQKTRCAEWAKQNGYKFVYFEDNNKTGDNLNRQGYKDMTNFVKQNDVKCIVVWKLDRLTRNIEHYYGVIQPFLREHNTTIASIEDSFDDIFKVEPMVLAVFIGMSAQELKNIKTRTKSVVEHRAKNGYALGKAPVGYLNIRNQEKRGIIVPDESVKHHIVHAFELYATGLFSMERVGVELAKSGFLNSKGKPYPKKRIEDILKSPLYMGKVMYEGQLYDGKHEAIISPELFYRVQAVFSGSSNKKPRGNVYTYSNIIKCAKCGYTYVGITKHGAHKSGTYKYYHCSNYKGAHVKERNISEHLLDEAMQEVIDSFDITDNEIKSIKKDIYSAIEDLRTYEKKSIDDLKKQYEDIVDTITQTLINKNTGILSEETCNEALSKLEKRKLAINCEIMNLSENSRDTVKRINILIDFANRIPELYLKATLDEKRLILATITDEITFDEDTNKLTVKLNPVFEHLRQIKLQNKEVFSADLETLTGTLETRSAEAKEILRNQAKNLSNIEVIGTRKSRLNTKIEPHNEGSKKLNVDGGT